MKLTTHIHLVPRSIVRGAIPPPPNKLPCQLYLTVLILFYHLRLGILNGSFTFSDKKFVRIS